MQLKKGKMVNKTYQWRVVRGNYSLSNTTNYTQAFSSSSLALVQSNPSVDHWQEPILQDCTVLRMHLPYD